VRHAEPLRPRGAVALVAVEQLQHRRRLAEGAHALLDAVAEHRIDQVDTSIDPQGVRGARDPLLGEPAEAVLMLVHRPPLRHAAP
jgi:hypothetical protein